MDLRKIIWAIIGLISAIYLLNPTFGFLELIPDNMPIVGNLDEGGAAILLVAALREFGLDLSGALSGKSAQHSLKSPSNENKKSHEPNKQDKNTNNNGE